MGLSSRMLLIDERDRFYRLSLSKFMKMLETPRAYPVPFFAGQRIRTASAIVECLDRTPSDVIRITFDILSFDRRGRFQASRFIRQQALRAELAMAPVIAQSVGDVRIVKATDRFLEQGGRWTPSRALARTIHDAVLGRIRCPRV